MKKRVVHYQQGVQGGKVRVGYCGFTEPWNDGTCRWVNMDRNILRMAETHGHDVCEKCGERGALMALAAVEL